ncbi:unnamed protein product [Closterium sp. Naga37s-1]|nr:unnamed protein product [Closterium sp. Naga37s-1]
MAGKYDHDRVVASGLQLRGTPEDSGATRRKTVASRRSLADSPRYVAMPSSPKASRWSKAKKACVGGAKKCAKLVADKVTFKDVAKMAANEAASGSGMAIDAAGGVAAARKGDKKGVKNAAVNVAKGAGSLAAAALVPHGALAFSATSFAAGKAKPHVEKAVKEQKEKRQEKRNSSFHQMK